MHNNHNRRRQTDTTYFYIDFDSPYGSKMGAKRIIPLMLLVLESPRTPPRGIEALILDGSKAPYGPKAPQEVPKDPPRHPPRSKSYPKRYLNGCPTRDFFDIFLVPSYRRDWGGKPTVVPPLLLRARREASREFAPGTDFSVFLKP